MARRDAILRDFHEDKTEPEPGGSAEKQNPTNKERGVSSTKAALSTQKEASKKKKQGSS